MFQASSSDSLPSSVVIVDDDPSTRTLLSAYFTGIGYTAKAYSSPLNALNDLTTKTPEAVSDCTLIVCDLMMPEMDGIEFTARANKLTPGIPVILITAHATTESALEAISRGAFDYIAKPIDLNELRVISERAQRMRQLTAHYRSIKKQEISSWALEDIVGKSPQMLRVFDSIKRISHSACNVMITGESGTGKDMVARAIHARGPRSKKPFVAINCTAIPDTLLESELFGHARGSFTGATEKRRGLLEEAHEGTVFLDEIGDMPLQLQVKLLRFLQDRKLKAIGDNTYRSVDVRILSATNTNLRDAVTQGRFREDLYFRLCVVPIEISPLRQRREDIMLLAERFLDRYVKKTQSSVVGFTQAALAKLTRAPWPGNVRELENVVERAIVFCDKAMIDEVDIVITDTLEAAAGPANVLFAGLKSLRAFEQEYIEYVLLQTGNRKEKAAEVLRISRKTLYRKQRDYQNAVRGSA